jgi:myo-inositol-1(or 4)-monophosphatase
LLDAKIPPHLKNDASLLFDTVRQAGALGLSFYRQGVKNWRKVDGSVVTEADLKIDDFLKERLHHSRPDYGWLSEESPDTPQRLNCARLWIADPIDGTQSFVNGTDGWCIGVALIENSTPILSALYRPVAEEFFWAVAGGGAYCNHVPLVPRDGPQLSGAELLGTGKATKILIPLGVKAMLSPHIPLLLRLAYVAAGRTDIALSFGNKNDWDLAAGDLLMRESGGKLSDLNGKEFIYNRPQPWQNGMLAAGKERHANVMKQLELL